MPNYSNFNCIHKIKLTEYKTYILRRIFYFIILRKYYSKVYDFINVEEGKILFICFEVFRVSGL